MKQRILLFFAGLLTVGLSSGQAARSATPPAPVRIEAHTQARAGFDDRTLVIYPNPSTGIVHLTINGLVGRRVELSVLNVIGTVMHHETLSELNERYTKTLDLTHFASGLYYVKLEADNSSKLSKLVIR